MKQPDNSQRKKRQSRQNDFQRQIKSKASRKLKQRKEGDRTIWYGLAMFGIVGWSVTIPTLIGIGIGIWLDFVLKDSYSWTLMMLFLGITVGCLNAWYWIKKESENE